MSSSPTPPDQRVAASSEQEARASLRTLRTLLLLCVLVPMVLYAIFAAYRYRQAHEEAEVRLDRALRIANEHALKVLETNDTMLRHVLDLADGAESATPERRLLLHRQLQAIARDKPQIQSIWVLGADGTPIATDRFESPPAQLTFGDREYFTWHRQRAAADHPLHFSEVMMGQATGEAFFAVSHARAAADGSFAGLVSVSLAPSYFLRFHADLSANEPGLAITMFRQDGTVYSRWPPLASAPPRMARTSPVLSRVLAGDTEGAIRGISSLDRQDRVILFRRVGDYPVYLGTGLELSAIRSGWAREMALLGAMGAIPVLGLLVAALLAMRRARQSLDAARRLREEAQARLQIEDALRQAQKMEAVGRLTGGVAHDFNNALMVISANLHMLKLTQPGIGQKQTDAIGRAVDSATKLTRQLLAFSRRQALTPQVVRLQERLPLLKDLISPVLGSQVPVTVEVASDTAPVKIDVAELELALLNLAVNAKDAMPQGGSFRVAAHNATDPQVPDGHAVVIAATDTGAGIAPEVLARVFEPFFTTKPVGEGTGLGLSQVYGLCQRSGGTARVRSEVGVGTTVEMVLPAVHGETVANPETEQPPGRSLECRVLVVEDNTEVAAAIRPVLETLGCEVTHFAAAAPALEWLDRHPEAVDVVLTDVVMPGDMDGLALAQRVRERHPRLGLLVMTGYAEQLDQITRQGFTVLAKPWTASHLAQALRTAHAAARSARGAGDATRRP
jgi:signal transduction histidine kinase/ActR/RegA family two-component response regulator